MAQASEFLDALVAIVGDEQHRGADRLGERVATRVAHDWGGLRVYFSQDRARRNSEIYALFTGNNYDDLARKYRLAEETVRRIVKQELVRRRAKQLTLFPTGERS